MASLPMLSVVVAFAVLLSNAVLVLCDHNGQLTACDRLNTAVNRFGVILYELNEATGMMFSGGFDDQSLTDDSRFQMEFSALLGNLSEIHQAFRIRYLQDETTESRCWSQILEKLAKWLDFFVRMRQVALEQAEFYDDPRSGKGAFKVLKPIVEDSSALNGMMKLILLLEATDADKLTAFRQHCQDHDPSLWLGRLSRLPFLFKNPEARMSRDNRWKIEDISDIYKIVLIYKTQMAIFLTAACNGLPNLTDLQYEERQYSSDVWIRKAVASMFGIGMVKGDLTNYLKSVAIPRLIAQDSNPQVAATTLLDGLNEKFPWLRWSVYGSLRKTAKTKHRRHIEEYSNFTVFNLTFEETDLTERNAFLTYEWFAPEARAMMIGFDGKAELVKHDYVVAWSWTSDDVYSWNKSPYSSFVEVYKDFKPLCSNIQLGLDRQYIFDYALRLKQPWEFPSVTYIGEKAPFFHQNGRMMTLDICNDYVTVFGD